MVKRWCVICGRQFYVPSENTRQLTCSPACSKKHTKNLVRMGQQGMPKYIQKTRLPAGR